MKNVAATLGVLLFAVFWLTASGHTYSPDEESMVYVTQAFVTHQDFNIPNPGLYPVTGGHRGIGGEVYSGTGLAQSLISLPFYVAGQVVAGLFDPRWRALILRFVIVSLFNSIVSALTGMLLFVWLRRLHVSARVALALVLIWAFATMVWIYARTFYSEPLLTLCFVLAGYATRAYHDTRALRWMFVAGLAAGLAVLAKVQGVLVLPALGLYFISLDLHRDLPLFLPRSILPAALFGLALGLGLGLTGYFDFVRFGDLFQTGRGDVLQGLPILTGLEGLLISPGKSVFLYAPPVILFFFALSRFLRRHPAEAVLCLVLIATFIVFHARLLIWSGDGAWGPRYLVPTLPFWVLPIGSALGEWWHYPLKRLAVTALVAAGFGVNLLGLAINFDAYIQMEPVANARYFNPSASPLLWQWNLLRERIGDWWGEVVAGQNVVVLLRGFLARADDNLLPRYLAPHATLLVKTDLGQPLQLNLLVYDYRPADRPKRRLTFLSNGLALEARAIPTGDSGMLSYSVQIPANRARWLAIDLVTLGSDSVGTSPMGDELGLHLQTLEIGAGQQRLGVDNYMAIAPLPTADPKMMWAWFYQPANEQFDFFWWYLYFTGLEDAQVVAISAVIFIGGLVLIGVSANKPLEVLFKRTNASELIG